MQKIKTYFKNLFSKVPPIILVPLVLITAFGIAAFLIWAGIKLSPVEIQNPEGYAEERKKNQNSKVKITDTENEDSQSSQGDWESNSEGAGGDPEEFKAPPSPDKPNPNKESSQNIVGLPTQSSKPAPQTNTNSNDGTSQVKEENVEAPSYTPRAKSENVNINPELGGSSHPDPCTYPDGDINVWWHTASQKQKDCYIAQHGLPNFKKEEPYFCDYNKSQDCFYLEYN